MINWLLKSFFQKKLVQIEIAEHLQPDK